MRVEMDPAAGTQHRATEWWAPEVALSTAAHELRNSLAPLTYSVAILASQGDESAREAAGRVAERQLDCMRRLITDLEELGGTPGIRLDALLVQEQLDAALQACSACNAERLPRIRRSFANEPLWIRGDAQRLNQVFGNLLSNAVKFTGRAGTITVSAAKAGGWAEVRISDTGTGIACDQLEHIFELFQREVRTAQVSKGYGIGLAVVRRLVGLHGGTVRAESAGPGRGTTMVVQLPLQPPPAPPS